MVSRVSVPFPGFTQLQPTGSQLESLTLACFSPVSRIHSIATSLALIAKTWSCSVSVPFPGFTQLQPYKQGHDRLCTVVVSVPFPGFTQLQLGKLSRFVTLDHGFSPVSRIHSIATPESLATAAAFGVFQSRFQDSLNCNAPSLLLA